MDKLKVCIISKYPPVQGGMSSISYWLSRGLGNAGIEVHVVTDGNLVEDDYRIQKLVNEKCNGVSVHYVPSELPWHIPYTEHRLARLIDKSLEVCEQFGINIIDAHYLVPYGFAANIINSLTGIPYVVRHGGSDIHKFFYPGHFPYLMKLVFQHAAVTVSNNSTVKTLSPNVKYLPGYVPDETCFLPSEKTRSQPLKCAYVGKINYHWEHKGLHKIAEILKDSNVQMYYLSQGKGKADFIKKCNPDGFFYNFIHPGEVPSFLSQIDFLFYFLNENPFPVISNTVLEAVCMGIPILTDRIDLFSPYQEYFLVEEWVYPIEHSINGALLSDYLEKIEKPKPKPLKISFNSYIESNIKLYQSIYFSHN